VLDEVLRGGGRVAGAVRPQRSDPVLTLGGGGLVGAVGVRLLGGPGRLARAQDRGACEQDAGG